jgi:lipopolysaccharide heptosyltransferase II
VTAAHRPLEIRPGDRVLVSRLDYLGDVVLSLPLVDAIRAAFPGVEVDYLARRPGADLLVGEARIARVFTLERAAGTLASLRLIRDLRARRYRAVIDLYSNPRSAWLSWFSGAPIRVGSDRRGRRRLYTHPMRVGPDVRAATRHHMALAAPLGIEAEPGRPTLAITDDERASAREVLTRAGIGVGGNGPRIGVHPGGKWSVKRWPTEKFAALVVAARERLGARVALFTGPGEEQHTAALSAAVGEGAVVLDAMPVRLLAAVMSELDGVVACDGGAMHVAVAVGTPTVGIFGSSEPEVWFPYEALGPFRAAVVPLECRPCHRHECPLGHTDCLGALSPDAVLGLVASVIDGGGKRS